MGSLIEYALLCLLVCATAAALWDLARRRALADRRRRALEPYARLGEGIEGVAHDARHLLRAASATMERLVLLQGASGELRTVAELGVRQVREADSFLAVLGAQPDAMQEFDAISCLRLAGALQPGKRAVDLGAVDGALPVYARPRDLSRLFANLLANGLRHGGRVHVGREEDALCFRNPLVGPAPGDEIYQRGATSNPRSKGLGLALCRQLASECGAELGHRVEAPKGSMAQPLICFRLRFARWGSDG